MSLALPALVLGAVVGLPLLWRSFVTTPRRVREATRLERSRCSQIVTVGEHATMRILNEAKTQEAMVYPVLFHYLVANGVTQGWSVERFEAFCRSVGPPTAAVESTHQGGHHG